MSSRNVETLLCALRLQRLVSLIALFEYVCYCKTMSEPIKNLTVAALSEKLEKFMGNLQTVQQKTNSFCQ